jgi:hypothetical protein
MRMSRMMEGPLQGGFGLLGFWTRTKEVRGERGCCDERKESKMGFQEAG